MILVHFCWWHFCLYLAIVILEPSEVDFQLFFLEATSQVKISWEDPKEPNGPIDHYVIHYAWTNENIPRNITSTIRRNQKFVVIEISCIPTPVSFQMWAVNTFEGSAYIGDFGSPKEVHVCSDIDKGIRISTLLPILFVGFIENCYSPWIRIWSNTLTKRKVQCVWMFNADDQTFKSSCTSLIPLIVSQFRSLCQ